MAKVELQLRIAALQPDGISLLFALCWDFAPDPLSLAGHQFMIWVEAYSIMPGANFAPLPGM